MLEESTTLTQNFLEVISDPQPVTIVSYQASPAHVVNTWSSYIKVVDDSTFLVPAAGMRSIEADIAAQNSQLILTFGSMKFEGTEGPGRGYHVYATGEFVEAGEYFDLMKADLPWLRKVVIVHVQEVKQKI